MVAATKLRVKFGPEESVETFQTSPDTKIQHSFGEEDQTKKRRYNELEDIQAKKKQKLDCILSSQCLTVLKLLMDHHVGWIFNVPVDPVKLMIPDYFSIISNPMDLGTVKSKLLKNKYSNVDEFVDDVRLTFNNALMYNPTNNWVHKIAKELKEIFEVRWELLKKKKVSKISAVKVTEGSKSSPEASSSSRRFYVEEPKPAKEKSEKVSLLSKPMKGMSKTDAPAVTPKAFATKLRIEKHNQGLGVGSAAKIPSKGSARTPAFKYGSCGRNICICFKTCNSSGSDASTLMYCRGKNASGLQVSESNPNCNGCVSSQLDKPLDSGLLGNELETTIPDLPMLSPNKALRAAMFRSQYADTILKARNRNVLDKSNKADLTRIQIEKKEMERTQREEKARIEAGMKAAKIAAQMRAQAELKQKRERQRLELEKMKKDYDFDENNHWRLEKDFVNICGSNSLRRGRQLLKELGLVLRNDYWPELEEIKTENFDAMRLDDLEEGEIF